MENELPVLFMSKESEGREGIAERTIKALSDNLTTYLSPLVIYLSVAGSPAYYEKLKAICFDHGFSVKGMLFDGSTPGFAWNRVIEMIFRDGYDLYLRMEDDFELKDILNINPYIELLTTKQEIGMVRLGLMPINLKLFSVGWYDERGNGYIFFDCLPTTAYAYSGNPGLVHKRLHDQVGYFHEEHNPGDIEIDFDSRIRDNMVNGGCRIWYPLDLGKYGTYGPWQHIGEVKSY